MCGLQNNSVWDSGMKFIPTIVLVKREAINIIKALCYKFPDTEFSVLFKTEFSNNGIVVTSEYYIPKQEVSGASVDYLEDLALVKKEGFNAIVHKHPGSGNSKFSSADMDFINKNFMCSILVNSTGRICQCLLNIKINDDTVIQIPEAKVSILDDEPLPDIDGLENITVKTIDYGKYYNYGTGEYTVISYPTLENSKKGG